MFNKIDNPLVSICVPTYNGQEHLIKCLETISQQTYTHIEILLIDDCSSDQTVAVIEEYQKIDNRIRFVQNEKNLGLVGNWNKCIAEAKGEWIKFQFQDDVMVPSCIQHFLDCCHYYNAPMAVSARNFQIESNVQDSVRTFFTQQLIKLEHYLPKQKYISPQELALIVKDNLLNNIIGEPIVGFFHKTIFERFGVFDTFISQLVDYEYFLRVATNIGMVFIPQPLVTFRVHGESETSKNRGQSEEITEKELKTDFIDHLFMLSQYCEKPIFKNLRVFSKKESILEEFLFYYNYSVKQLGAERFEGALLEILNKKDYHLFEKLKKESESLKLMMSHETFIDNQQYNRRGHKRKVAKIA